MSKPEIERVPNARVPSKSSVSLYRFPAGGGLFWAVAASSDKTLDFAGQTQAVLDALDAHMRRFGVERRRVVKAEVVVTDHDNKPIFDEVWSRWMPAGHGPVRSFVESRMPEGDLVEVIITAALPSG